MGRDQKNSLPPRAEGTAWPAARRGMGAVIRSGRVRRARSGLCSERKVSSSISRQAGSVAVVRWRCSLPAWGNGRGNTADARTKGRGGTSPGGGGARRAPLPVQGGRPIETLLRSKGGAGAAARGVGGRDARRLPTSRRRGRSPDPALAAPAGRPRAAAPAGRQLLQGQRPDGCARPAARLQPRQAPHRGGQQDGRVPLPAGGGRECARGWAGRMRGCATTTAWRRLLALRAAAAPAALTAALAC